MHHTDKRYCTLPIGNVILCSLSITLVNLEMIKITEKERQMIFNIGKNCYTDGDPGAEVWADCLWDNGPYSMEPTSVPGIVGSLVKKGLVHSGGERAEDACVQLTEKGLELFYELEKTEKGT